MRKVLVVYLSVAIVLLGGLSAVGQTLDLKSISNITRVKQVAKQEKVDYIAKTLSSPIVKEALQKAGLKLTQKEAEQLAKFVPAKKLDFIYSQCLYLNDTMTLGQYGGGAGMGTVWVIMAVAGAVVLIILLIVLLDTADDVNDYWYY